MEPKGTDRGIDTAGADVPEAADRGARSVAHELIQDTRSLAPAGQPARPVRATVVVPTLNEEKRLGTLLATFSRERRALHGLEVVVSDGGSTDGTLELGRALADRVVVHQGSERQTIGAGRNAGARASAGNLLLFLNADVRLPEDVDGFLEAVLAAAAETGAATCRVSVHPDEAKLIDRLVLGLCDRLFLTMNKLGMGMARGECHAVRKSVFLAVGGYNESLVAGEDFDLFKRIASWGRRTRAARVSFLWDWMIWEDPRRYRQRGYFRTMFDWFRNTASITLFGRSHSKEWEPIR